MAIIPSCDPATLVQQANCYKCIPKAARDSIRAFLKCQILNIATPPCITPSGANRLKLCPSPVGNPNPGNTTICVNWAQVKNSGSLVTGYQVFWGTTSGGPYPNSSPILPLSPRSYTITGLTSGTQYFIVVQAIAFAGCVSALSSEFTATTTGNPPNGLLNGLVHFYQFQEAASLFADSGSDPISLQYTNAGANFSRVAGHVQAFAGNYADAAGPNSVGTIAAAPFDFTGDGTGNIPMTWALWARLNGVAGAQPATLTMMSVHTPVYFFAWLNSNNFEFSMQTSGGVQTNVTSPFVYDNNWHLLIGGFDKANGVIYLSVDNGAKVTAAVAAVKSVNSTSYNIGNCSACGANNGNWSFSDCATWLNVTLTDTQRSQLWNGGAGLPFSQFTH